MDRHKALLKVVEYVLHKVMFTLQNIYQPSVTFGDCDSWGGGVRLGCPGVCLVQSVRTGVIPICNSVCVLCVCACACACACVCIYCIYIFWHWYVWHCPASYAFVLLKCDYQHYKSPE